MKCNRANQDGDSSIFRRLISLNGFYSERFFYSERSFLRTVFSPLIRKAYYPKGHDSENFNSEMPLCRTVFDTKGFYSERFLFQMVLIPKGRFSEIRNKNLSDQKPFGSKNFMMSKNSPKLKCIYRGQIWQVWDGDTVLNWSGGDIEFHWYYEDDDTKHNIVRLVKP